MAIVSVTLHTQWKSSDRLEPCGKTTPTEQNCAVLCKSIADDENHWKNETKLVGGNTYKTKSARAGM